MPKEKIDIYVMEFDPPKTLKVKNKRISKIGISNNSKRRFDEVCADSGFKNGRIIFNTQVLNAFDVEQRLHSKHKTSNIHFPQPFSGHTEFFDIDKVTQKSVVNHIKSFQIGAYSEDYKEANLFNLFLCFIAPFVIYFILLYFKK